MRLGTLALAAVALLLQTFFAHVVTADYAPCSDPATCGAVNNCCTEVNGVNYCCPGDGNWLDFNTKRCANFAQCGQSQQLDFRTGCSQPVAHFIFM